MQLNPQVGGEGEIMATTQPKQLPKMQHLVEAALVLVGLLAMYGPTIRTLDATVWNIVGQGHGPIMLALTVWLAWRRRELLLVLPSHGAKVSGSVFLLFGLVAYLFGRTQDVLLFEVGSMIWVLLASVLLWKGWPGAKVMWFPLFFILFIIPLPGAIVDSLTGPLKAGVSYVAEALLYQAGYPVGRAGVTLSIGPYKLLVADACAGLNSIFALEAVGVFYMSVMQHQSKLRNVLLAVLILPISFVSNVTRVIVLVLVTYYFGDAAGQGFVHDFAGIVLFMVATFLTVFTDSFLGLFFKSHDEPRGNQNTLVS